jgi:trk system potassium uptake protein TrkH
VLRASLKVVLITTGILILSGAALFFIFEGDAAFSGLSTGKRVLASFFQAITPRTAGFSTVHMSTLSESGTILTVILMFIGGSPGSTAGGIKTTTLAVLVLGMFAASRHNNNIVVFKKRLGDDIVKQASAIATVYIFSIIIASLIIAAIEPFTAKQVIFEVVSAVGTVGLTTGITPELSGLSRIVLTVMMYAGRVGGLTLMLALAEKRYNVQVERPFEKVLIG